MNDGLSIETNLETFDVVVIGCGPSGAVLSAYLARAGCSVLTLEQSSFPRFHVGESLTGMAGEVIRELGLGEAMERLQYPPKSGVKVIGKEARSEFFVPVAQPTWQVRRDTFDALLMERAQACGAMVRQGTVKEILREGDRAVGVRYQAREAPEGRLTTVRCAVVADASGRGTVLARQGLAGAVTYHDQFARQVALFSTFKGVRRDPGRMGDNTFIFYSETYHWAWFIPVAPDLVSVGVVLPGEKIKALSGREEAYRWGLDHLNPDLTWRVAGCETVEPLRAITNYSYAVDPFVGNGWLCVGDAHQFIDPIFSFGVSFAMLEARRASAAIQEALATGDCTVPFEAYARFSNQGQHAARDLIRYFWRFPVFFGYQTRSHYRKDIIRLLSSNCHTDQEIPAITMMRQGLKRYEQKQSTLAA